MSELEIALTHSGTRRHLSDTLAPSKLVPGRMGKTFCEQAAYDQERLAWHRAAENVELEDMSGRPCCSNCERGRRARKLDAPKGWNP